jgi:CRP-like cAMP-binding protein
MSAPGQDQLGYVLRIAKSSLEYLTSNDWRLIIDRAKRLKFNKNEALIREGKPSNALYLIVAGTVVVTVSGSPLAKLGPGQICGDMAFLENTHASATASAEEDTEVYALEHQTLVDLFEMFPHLASRFYRSLAVNLSRRLREQIVRG